MGTVDNINNLRFALASRYFRLRLLNASLESFQHRKQGTVEEHPNVSAKNCLGRIYTIHPNNDECYYFPLQQLRTVNGRLWAILMFLQHRYIKKLSIILLI